jgi:hypothetical protein
MNNDLHPHPIDLKASDAVFRLAWSTYQKSSALAKPKLPKGWILSSRNSQAMVRVQGMIDTIRLLDICLRIYPELNDGGNRITVQNLKAVALWELGKLDAAAEAYEKIVEWAQPLGDIVKGSLHQAETSIELIKEQKNAKDG